MIKKIISLLIVFMMIFTIAVPTNVSGVSKDYTGHWAQDTIQLWLDKEYITGYPDGSFKPEGKVTRVEFITMVNNLFNYTEMGEISFADVKVSEWYYQDVQKAFKAGYITGVTETQFAPNENITREQAAVILSRIMNVEGNSAAAEVFTDSSKISSWAKDGVGASVKAEFVGGYEDKSFKPLNSIKRAEAVVMLNKTIADTADLVIDKAGTVVENVTMENLYITDKVGEGEVTLKNVIVTGELLVEGGGENSIKIEDSDINKLTINKENGKVRILIIGNTRVYETLIKTGAILEQQNLVGIGFRQVIVDESANERQTLIVKANIGGLLVNAKFKINIEIGIIEIITIQKPADNSSIHIAENATALLITVDAKTSFTGIGRIASITINANGVSFGKIPEVMNISDGIKEPEVIPLSFDGNGSSGSRNIDSVVIPVSSININKSDLVLRVGETVELKAIIEPSNATNKNVLWNSNNTAVALINDNGIVMTNTTGTAIITAATDNGKKASITIYVTNLETEIPVSVSLYPASISVYVGDETKLMTMFANATKDDLTWSSNNTDVASVSTDGTITGVSTGTAIITATITNKNGTSSSNCTVTVTVNPEPISWEYTVNENDTLTITKYLGNKSIAEIPKSIDGRLVIRVEGYEYTLIKELNIPSSVEYVDTSIFYRGLIENINVDINNRFYKSIDGVLFNKSMDTLISYPMGNSRTAYSLPDGVNTIAFNAFATTIYNESILLSEIYIPNSVNSIEDIRSLEARLFNIYVDDENTVYKSIDGVLFNKSGDELLCYPYANERIEYSVPEGTKIMSEGFHSTFGIPHNLTVLRLPSSIETLPILGFKIDNLENIYVDINNKNFASVEGVVFSKDLNTLIAYPKGNSRSSYSIPFGVTKVNDGAFQDGSNGNLKNITIPATLVDLGSVLRVYLENIFVDENHSSLKSISGVLFSKDGKTLIRYPRLRQDAKYIIPTGTETLDYSAFFNCNLSTLIIPDSVTLIESSSIEWCSLLEDVLIYNNNVSIRNNNFQGCKGVMIWSEGGSTSSIFAEINNIPFALLSNYADTETWEYVTNEDNTVTITKYLGNKEIIYIPEIIDENPVKGLHLFAFANNRSLKSINIPHTIENIISSPSGRILENYTVSLDNKYYKAVDGILYNYDGTVLISYPEGRVQSSFMVPNTVEIISECAFYGNSYIKNIIMQNNLRKIEQQAFSNCNNLIEVAIPPSVEIIGHYIMDYSEKVIIKCYKNSEAEYYAIYYGINYDNSMGIVDKRREIYFDISCSGYPDNSQCRVYIKDALGNYDIYHDGISFTIHRKKPGDTVEILVKPIEGYKLVKNSLCYWKSDANWYVNETRYPVEGTKVIIDAINEELGMYEFVMPDYDIGIEANFELISH